MPKYVEFSSNWAYGGRSLVVDIASAKATGPAFKSFFFFFFYFLVKSSENVGKIAQKLISQKMWTGKLEKAAFLAILDYIGK